MDDLLPVAEYQIDRGRAYELDRVDTGRATIQLHDIEGLLDPTNTGGSFYGDIQPLKQARLAIWNPVLEDWYTRFRGFVSSYEYDFDPSQLVNRVTINLVDIFEIVNAVQMFPGYFGDPPPTAQEGQVVFFEDTLDGDEHGMQIRIGDILTDAPLGNCGIPNEFYNVFSGNVSLHETSYSPGESAMAAIQDAVDAEFPGVGNVYGDRLGRLCVHGRFARFDPVTTEAETPGWDFHDWNAGDGAAVAASPSDTAHIRAFSISRDLDKVINVALASPHSDEAEVNYATQVVVDDTSKGKYGIRAWSAQDLYTKQGITPPSTVRTDWVETKRFAQYYVENYAEPLNRVTSISFRSMNLNTTGAAANWLLLSEIDINDRVAITLGSPGGGGFTGEQFYVEGVHETYRPAGPEMDDITLSLDLSPFDYFQDSPFGT